MSGADDPPVAPAPVDPSDPGRDIYGNDSFPSVDGRNAWPALMDSTQSKNATAVHAFLVLSKEVLIAGDSKLLVAQNAGWAHKADNGWKTISGSAFANASGQSYSCDQTDLPGDLNTLPGIPGSRPCLFALDVDPREMSDLAAGANVDPSVLATVTELWAKLNHTVLTAFCRNFTTAQGCMTSPAALLGPCNPACAADHWRTTSGSDDGGPICGVPGCSAA